MTKMNQELGRDTHTGFTLLEIAVVVGIIGLVAALALVSFANSRKARDLVTNGQNALSVLRLAQAKAVAGDSGVPWGVRLEQTRFILFSGASFAASPTTTIYMLPTTIEIRNIFPIAASEEVVFHRLDGITDQSSTFDVGVVGSAAQTFSVTIDASGHAYQTGNAPMFSQTRIVDARHRNFALGWSIKNAATMTLTFSDPYFTQNFTMPPPAPRTDFDWSGAIVVGGQNQILRLHALAITDTATTLSVDRDCRYNTKKLAISIDAKLIATYEADCKTVSVGPYGGAMSEP